ncbi:flagellar basal body P-ring formation chaperone FlgA [Pseudomonas sp. PSKL.D1]|uniref:flagellar basal body P-ring formation chaperone FlgA n=1 Tax=Pseudomonas sp. PSKL.D1 TaxID=3029060 RepID=UPI00238136D4|nr:flagellar basal body P-ring formation chaperone FlgA [Pseudomonas sp. PSKL.D1]WDY57875.1 flagellar basal body P-ring formation chaperone FlgA [Pseudomonas sp. PSKL.D1]
MTGSARVARFWLLLCLLQSGLAMAERDVLQERVRRLIEPILPSGSRLTLLDIGQPVSRIQACAEPQPYLVHPRALAVGRVPVGVRCSGQDAVLGYLQVQVSAVGNYVIATRKIEAGDIIQPNMLASRRGPLQDLPKGSALRAEQLVGRQAARGVDAGAVLALKGVRERWLVQRNRTVVLRSKGAGFSLSRNGKALDNGGMGSTVRVLSDDGRTFSAQVIGNNELLLR